MATIWVIAVLSIMLFTTGALVQTDVELSMQQKKAFRAVQLAEMGIAVAANPVTRKHDRILLVKQVADGEGYEVKITGEGGKFNLNSLLNGAQPGNLEFLQIIFVSFGMEKETAQKMIDNLVDWTDANDEKTGTDSLEKEDYEKMGQFNYPFNRPFYNLDEALLVPGMNELSGMKDTWRNYFTIYSQGALDINEANAEVLALVGLQTVADAEQFFEHSLRLEDGTVQVADELKHAQELVEQRWGADKEEGTEDDEAARLSVEQVAAAMGIDGQSDDSGTPLTNRITAQDGTVRIESTGILGVNMPGQRFRKQIVVVMRNRSNAPQILQREEISFYD
jgi:general secretion pathway protein K